VHGSKRFLALEDERGERETNHYKSDDGDLQVGIHHERIAILFQIALRGSCDLGGGFYPEQRLLIAP
jgi:hypothetical protein